MVAALLFGMIGMIFYVIYESVYVEEAKKKEIFEASMREEE